MMASSDKLPLTNFLLSEDTLRSLLPPCFQLNMPYDFALPIIQTESTNWHGSYILIILWFKMLAFCYFYCWNWVGFGICKLYTELGTEVGYWNLLSSFKQLFSFTMTKSCLQLCVWLNNFALWLWTNKPVQGVRTSQLWTAFLFHRFIQIK
jgi:hypothetical protein